MPPIHALWRNESLKWRSQVQIDLEKNFTEHQHLQQTEKCMLHR